MLWKIELLSKLLDEMECSRIQLTEVSRLMMASKGDQDRAKLETPSEVDVEEFFSAMRMRSEVIDAARSKNADVPPTDRTWAE
jgi:hypothetical protein